MDTIDPAPGVQTMEAQSDKPTPGGKRDNAMCSSYGMDYIIPLTTCFVVSEREAVVNLFCGMWLRVFCPPWHLFARWLSSYLRLRGVEFETNRGDGTMCAHLFGLLNLVVLPARCLSSARATGNYIGTIDKPGFYLRNWVCVEGRKVSMAIQSLDVDNVKTADANGNPLLVSGIVSWSVVDARRAALDVADPRRFVADQAPAVLKRVVAQYPYEDDSPPGSVNVPSLRTETDVVANRLCAMLQTRVDVAGVRVLSFQLNELSYAPEIAESMLKRQAADALIAARAKIVAGAVGIARDAVASEALGAMSDEERARTVRDLLIVLVGERQASPVMTVGG